MSELPMVENLTRHWVDSVATMVVTCPRCKASCLVIEYRNGLWDITNLAERPYMKLGWIPRRTAVGKHTCVRDW